MKSLLSMSKSELEKLCSSLRDEYEQFKSKSIKLDMSRGKPSVEQLNLSDEMLSIISERELAYSENGFDLRNYGIPDGIEEMKDLFSKMLGVSNDEIFVGGNSSLNMMFDTIMLFVSKGVCGGTPWDLQKNVKFLCPVPGYDRHFAITEYFGIEMINIPMNSDGPDMDTVERLVSEDEGIKGIWCVPKYSNPQGITYSDEVVKRFASLKPKAKDFRIFWDNAYCVHDIGESSDNLLNLMDECKKNGNEDLPIMFTSTSKITFPGSGVAALACSLNNMKYIAQKYKLQTIGYDKLNMKRHILFLGSYEGMLKHMEKHKALLKPRFDIVLDTLENELAGSDIASWIKPNGGYFVSVDLYKGCAKRCVALCKDAGVTLTGAGATFPYGIDPDDSNIRIAPSFPSCEELRLASRLFCICAKIAAIEKLSAK